MCRCCEDRVPQGGLCHSVGAALPPLVGCFGCVAVCADIAEALMVPLELGSLATHEVGATACSHDTNGAPASELVQTYHLRS